MIYQKYIQSWVGFVMDKDNNYYILDQGIIIKETHTVNNDTSKLVIHYLNQTDGKIKFIILVALI